MQFKNFANVILLVISMSSIGRAQILEGLRPPGVGPAPYPGGPGPHPGPEPGWPGPHSGPSPGYPPTPPPYYPPTPPPYYPPTPPPYYPPTPPPYYPPTPPPYYPPTPPPYYPPTPPPYYPPTPPPYYPPTPPPYYPPTPPDSGGDVRHIFLNRYVVNESFDLRALAGLNYGSFQVVAVRANTRPNNSGRSVAQLLLDGRVVATQLDPSYQIVLIPQIPVVLDQTGRYLQLSISGSVFVDSIDVEIRSSDQVPIGQNVEINVFRSVVGNDRIDLSQLVDLWRLRGLRIQEVYVTATASYGSAAVNLIVNGLNLGSLQFTSGLSQRQGMFLNNSPMIGNGADILELYTSGDMTVEHVTLVVR